MDVHDANGLQPMPLPHLVVILVVRRGDLHSTWGIGQCQGPQGRQGLGGTLPQPLSTKPHLPSTL